MKKLLVIIFVCLFCFGCAKEEKNITINVYQNKEDNITEDEYEETKTQDSIENVDKEIVMSSKNIDNSEASNTIVSESKSDNTATLTTTNSSSIIKSKIDNAKNWYADNKDELKSISEEVKENDKSTLNELATKAKDWYNENKEPIKSRVKEEYNNDKDTLLDLYNKIKN